MHIVIALIVIFAVWKWGKWRNWEKYHHVMLFFALGNLLYNFLTANYFLWRLFSPVFPNHTTTEMLYTFIIFPGTALLFIGNYPEGKGVKKIILHFLTWIGLYISIEFVMTLTGHIQYQHGWHLGWSLIFNVKMFPVLRLYYTRPLLVYGLSIFFAIFWIWLFDVPVHIPVEDRSG